MTESAAYLEFVHLPTYVRSSKGLLDDEGQRAIEENLCNHPEAGDLIEDTGGVRKLRVALPGRGKRGGARLIYYFPKAKARIYLILLYPKGRKASLSAAEKREMRRLTRLLEAEQ